MPAIFLFFEAPQVVLQKKRRRISRSRQPPFDIQVEPSCNRTRPVRSSALIPKSTGRAKEIVMLNATAQKLGDSTVLRCQGRIVIGDAYAILRNAVLRQTHTSLHYSRRSF